MFGKQVFVTTAAATVVMVGFALAPANADNKAPLMEPPKQVGLIAAAPIDSTDFEQDQVARSATRR